MPDETGWLTMDGFKQITNPMGAYEVFEKSVSNGDHSFDAKHDGKFIYCFGNEHWGASSKEVSFNVHGIVYVSESDGPTDPLEAEGMFAISNAWAGRLRGHLAANDQNSQETLRASRSSQRRAVLHRRARAHPPQHRREYQQPRQVVECFYLGCGYWGVCFPGLVAEEVLRGQESGLGLPGLA